jgi:uncharacterized protein (UPF0248 family)
MITRKIKNHKKIKISRCALTLADEGISSSKRGRRGELGEEQKNAFLS